jgi:hypothetical protein
MIRGRAGLGTVEAVLPPVPGRVGPVSAEGTDR